MQDPHPLGQSKTQKIMQQLLPRGQLVMEAQVGYPKETVANQQVEEGPTNEPKEKVITKGLVMVKHMEELIQG
jgi:hypothetical protein